jgi:hypothetical protein
MQKRHLMHAAMHDPRGAGSHMQNRLHLAINKNKHPLQNPDISNP